MAVCGRCMICGYKFSCDETDEAISWPCRDERCNGREHKICVKCHDVLVHDEIVETAVADLLAIVARRSEE